MLQSGSTLARGVTIATRYCAVRRQFQDLDAAKDAVGENQVLNYTMVQYRLLPLLAATYALHFTGQSMVRLYQENQKRMSAAADGQLDARRRPGPEELNPGTDLRFWRASMVMWATRQAYAATRSESDARMS